MIRHVVMWRLKSRLARSTHSQVTERLEQNLAALRGSIPGLLQAWIGWNEADSADASDLVLYSEFDSWNSLHGYESHPMHDELRAIIGPLRSERRVADFEVSEERS
jgi:hypothetical protein